MIQEQMDFMLFYISKSCLNKSDLSHVNFEMFCEIVLLCVSFAALVALERLLPSVRHHVVLQLARRSASIIALVTLMWFFPCVLPHHVIFQLIRCNAGILTHCASVRLFPRMSPFMPLQVA